MNLADRPVPTSRLTIVAHRAGNDLRTARAAAAAGHVIEADVHVFRGRVEVRHEKVLRPFGRLWEPWFLLPTDTPRLELHEVLAAIGSDAALLLDLKCFTRSAARRIRAVVPEAMAVTVSSRSWWTLAAFADRPDTLALRSCANRVQLWWGVRLPGLGRRLGLTVRGRLLSPAKVRRLRERTPELYSWAVAPPDRVGALAEAGLTGLVLDDPASVSS